MKYEFHSKQEGVGLIYQHLQKHLQTDKPLVVGIVGGSGSGKTVVSNELQHLIGEGSVVVSQDDFMLSGTPNSLPQTPYVWDDPENFNLELCEVALRNLKSGRATTVPIFDVAAFQRIGKRIVQPQAVVLWEGIYAVKTKVLRNLCDVVIYIEAPLMIRLTRRISRYLRRENNSPVSLPAQQMLEFVQPAHDALVTPQRLHSDIILHYIPTQARLAEELRQFSTQGVIKKEARPKLASASFGEVVFELREDCMSIIRDRELLYRAEISQPLAKAQADNWEKLLASY